MSFHMSASQSRRYPAEMTLPFRQELTMAGFTELTTEDEVVEALERTSGSTLLVINSVCGCAAGAARPGVIKSLENATVPAHLVTVMAGQDLEAVAKARSYLTGMPPSSPSVALLKDGQLVAMLHRNQIEGRRAEQIADTLTAAYDQFFA